MTEPAYFSEEQRLAPWVTVLVVAAAGTSIAVFAAGIYVQLVQGEPWGDRPMSDTALAVVGGSFALLGPALIWLFASLKLRSTPTPSTSASLQ